MRNNRFTVLILTSSFPRYEGDYFGPWIIEYARELVRQNCRVIVLAPRVGIEPPSILSEGNLIIRRFNYWPIRKQQKLVHPPGMMPQIKSNPLRLFQIPMFLFAFYKEGIQLINEFNISIIHSQWVIPGGYVGALLKRKLNIPLVVTSQGAEFYLSKYHPFSWFTKWSIKRTDRLLPVSQHMSTRSISFGADTNRVQVVPNAVNTQIFRRVSSINFKEEYNIPLDVIVIMTIRRLVPEKRVQDLIEAVALLENKNVYLVIGGDGQERVNLENLVRQKSLVDRTKFIGFIDNADLPPIYSAADIYVLSSEQEGLSLSLLEAMACGCAVITTEGTGGDEISNIETYPVGDVQSLALRIGTLIESKRRVVLPEKYSVKGMIGEWLKVYSQLI